MSELTSESSNAEVRAAYDNNAYYRAHGSVAEAHAFAAACRILIGRVAKLQRHGEDWLEVDVSTLREELKDAEKWAERNGSTGRVKAIAMTRYRD